MSEKETSLEHSNIFYFTYKKLKKNGKKFYDKATDPKVVKISIYISLATFFPGLIIGIIVAMNFGGYSIWFNYISNLGSFQYTPAPFILDFTCMISSIFIIPLILNLNRLYSSNMVEKIDNSRRSFHINRSRRVFGYMGVVFLFLGVVGMFFVGVFSEDRSSIDLHNYFAAMAFGGFAFGAFFTGWAIVIKRKLFPKGIGYFMILGPSSASIFFLIAPQPLTRQFLEWIMLFSALAWYYTIVWVTLQKLNTMLFFNPSFKW
ncbi:hypothetical protein LCGC14_1610690 [marine sediment metagenome]|uniref:Frag1/DRAM/Sfk1 family protein n=1 Tax=marine sediment metagenome TaxID=412755 RepID=A0A0F9I8E6_9ZZZZ